MSAKKEITPEDWESLLDWLADGKFMRAWLRSDANKDADGENKYSRKVIERTCSEDVAKMAEYEAARKVGYDFMSEDTVNIADEVPRTNQFGGYDAADVSWKKLRIWTRHNAMSKWYPQKYGDKVTNELTGPNGGALKIERIELVALKP